jgi:hypothetical protein
MNQLKPRRQQHLFVMANKKNRFIEKIKCFAALPDLT